ncbi:MAG: hypothetical protein KatS3mg068_0009 [Candidatus Sericytochromatia bacterium]|nr:MAG: hypothetical protein KatS3mg068_0009 [Candidatus Sericytochromatia bacterium]
MIRFLISLFLSILLHIYFFSFIKINTYQKKTNIDKKIQIVYIKKKEAIIKKSVTEISKSTNSIQVNKKEVKSVKKNVLKKNNKQVVKKEIKRKIVDKTKLINKYDDEIQKKIEILRKNSYFKNWSDERLKKLELPPGMKSWDEVEKMTKYLDTQYNWLYTPPNLGNNENNKVTWKEFNIKDNIQIRFIFENTIFIAEFYKENNIVFITYFPKKEYMSINENLDIPNNIKDEDINYFQFEMTNELNNEQNKNIIISEYINKIIDFYKNN